MQVNLNPRHILKFYELTFENKFLIYFLMPRLWVEYIRSYNAVEKQQKKVRVVDLKTKMIN